MTMYSLSYTSTKAAKAQLGSFCKWAGYLKTLSRNYFIMQLDLYALMMFIAPF